MDNIKFLIKLQQAEVDGAVTYKKLASLVDNKEISEAFLKMAPDEAKHAIKLKKYTNIALKPSKMIGFKVFILYKILGIKRLLKMFAEGESKATLFYGPLIKKYPELQESLDDELRHSKILYELLGK